MGKHAKHLPLLLFFILLSFITLKHNVQSIVIILFVLSSVVINWRTFSRNLKLIDFKKYIFLVMWFILYVLTITYSNQKELAFNRITQQISIVILPIVMIYWLPNLNSTLTRYCYYVFIASNLIFSVYLDSHLLNNLNESYLKGLSNNSLLEQITQVFSSSRAHVFWHGLRDGENSFLFIHKTYFSSTFLFSSVLLVYLFFKEKSILLKSIFIFCVFYFGTHIYFYGSITNGVLFLLLIPITFFYYNKTKKSLIIGLFSGVFLLSVFGFVLNNKTATNDLNTKVIVNKLSLFTNFFNKKDLPNLDLDDRTIIYSCSYKLFIEKPLLGYGIENYQDALNECYLTQNRLQMALANINTHNHFFVMLLSGGLFLFITFLGSLIYLFTLSIKQQDFLFFSLLIIIVTNCLIESYLSRINGILFYTIFSAFYFKKCLTKKTS